MTAVELILAVVCLFCWFSWLAIGRHSTRIRELRAALNTEKRCRRAAVRNIRRQLAAAAEANKTTVDALAAIAAQVNVLAEQIVDFVSQAPPSSVPPAPPAPPAHTAPVAPLKPLTEEIRTAPGHPQSHFTLAEVLANPELFVTTLGAYRDHVERAHLAGYQRGAAEMRMRMLANPCQQ